MSFPLRERGLKLANSMGVIDNSYVVPLAGTWIETADTEKNDEILISRSPCGNVD